MAYRTGGADSGQRLSLLVSPRSPSLRFSSPLIEPGVRISRTPALGRFHVKACALPTRPHADRIRETARPASQIPHRWGTAGNQTPPLCADARREATDGVIEIQFHPVSRLRHRPIAEVGRPSPHRAVQAPRHVFPWRVITGPQAAPDMFLDRGHSLLGRPRTVVASAGSRRVHRPEGIAERSRRARIGRRIHASWSRSA